MTDNRQELKQKNTSFTKEVKDVKKGAARDQVAGPTSGSFGPPAWGERTGDPESRLEELRSLLARVEGEQEAEKRRIARELHDKLGQNVTGLGMALHILQRRAGEFAGPAAETMEDMRALLAGLSESMKNIVAELHPSVLDRIGFTAALARLAAESAERSGVRIEFSGPAQTEPCLSEELKTVLYRVAEESLRNALRHSGAALFRIRFVLEEGRIALEVEDHGRGIRFPEPGRRTDALGLVRMRERCEALGGCFSIFSAPGEGTTVRATFPLPTGSDDARPHS